MFAGKTVIDKSSLLRQAARLIVEQAWRAKRPKRSGAATTSAERRAAVTATANGSAR
jgi:hypothetical protein